MRQTGMGRDGGPAKASALTPETHALKSFNMRVELLLSAASRRGLRVADVAGYRGDDERTPVEVRVTDFLEYLAVVREAERLEAARTERAQ